MPARAFDRCPFIVNSERMVDPEDVAALWITIDFPEAMRHTHSDEQLMEFVVQQIQNHNTGIFTSAQHYQRHFCLSLPVVEFAKDENFNDFMAQAETLALWWLRKIRAHEAQLDRELLFL
ncbi:hypothetical protein N7517_001753 [Penicillium concentricum]|uniref:Uncharacterized protein n=1 Tax=Penicillium concentricum TaxID=293559 RepID=A0A9W9SSK8_9EURO|nr:uncharacterized protein N7517_001753 [Penicillium concentricum]KAJ5383842.1 hypothetical protein N7517_001753 [Penicillium concentricum]